MKKIALSLAVAAFAAMTIAAPAPKSISCCVMPKNKVDIAKATKTHMYADYKGNRYFFCCAGCPEAFKKDPAKYKNAPHIKTPKTVAKPK